MVKALVEQLEHAEAQITELKAREDERDKGEVVDDAANLETRKLVDSLKDQLLWVTTAAFLLGAGAGYILEKAFA